MELAPLIRALAAETFRSHRSDALNAVRELEERYGPPQLNPGFAARIPVSALATRDLVKGTGSAGGYLVDSRVAEYSAALRPKSVALRAGVPVIPVHLGDLVTPRGTTAASVTWLSTESTQATESQPAFAAGSLSPHHVACYLEVSRQLLLQSNAEDVIRRELTGAAATAIDAAVLTGSGSSGQPRGIINTSGIGSIVGASIGRSALVGAQTTVATAGAGHELATLAYLAPVAVAGLLMQRDRVSGTDSPLWRGAATEGEMVGVRAFASDNVPAGDLLYGDFAQAEIYQWESAELMVDPFTKMQQAIIGVRLIIAMDVAIRQPAAFTLATGVT